MSVSWEKFFSAGIRLVFVFAFGAFLWASIHHVAAFFHNFEPDNVDWSGSYALAISVDGTALMLTIGMMFFSANMPRHAKAVVWFFVFALTAFSWVVNWEYAVTFQSTAITGHLAPMWKDINPVLASSFAFLNLAYSVVAEFFTLRVKSVAELEAELNELTGEKATLERKIQEAKGPGLIASLKGKALEVKAAVHEVVTDSDKASPEAVSEPTKTEVPTEVVAPVHSEIASGLAEVPTEVMQADKALDTDPLAEALNVSQFPEMRQPKTTVPLNIIDISKRRKPLEFTEVIQVLGVSEKTVRAWKKSGKLATTSDGKFTVSSVRSALESRQERVS